MSVFSSIYRQALCPSLPAFHLLHSKEPLTVTYGKANKQMYTQTHCSVRWRTCNKKNHKSRPRETHTHTHTHWLSNKAAIMEATVVRRKGGVYGALSSQGIVHMHTHTRPTCGELDPCQKLHVGKRRTPTVFFRRHMYWKSPYVCTNIYQQTLECAFIWPTFKGKCANRPWRSSAGWMEAAPILQNLK